jgi:putative exporter of polyketide antibiotics
MRGLKHVILMSLALGMLFYSLPQLDFHSGYLLPTVYSVIWIGLALLVIAAHLHEILGVKDEQRRPSKFAHSPRSPLRGSDQG